MAEGVLLNIVAGLVANVASEPFKKIKASLGVKDVLRKLDNTLSIIQAVLRDVEEKKEINHQAEVWLDRLEDVAYDADNLLDEFRYQHLRRKVLFGKKKARKVRIFFSRSSNQLIFRYKMAKKIKKIAQTLDDIRADQVFSQLVPSDGEVTHVPSPMSWRETHSFVVDDEVIGREDDKKKIIELLLENNNDDKESVSFVSLVGFGGLGKTTLAQIVFNDELVKKHFEKQIWVCVSDVFDLKLLIRKIIEAITNKSPDQNLDLEPLKNLLRREIEGKRYLLVLDDVWREDRDSWEELTTLLKLGAKGSRVLLTTRKMGVAQITTHSTERHMLTGLDENNSWALFERVAFWKINNYELNDQYTNLVNVGKGIVEKCKGVPLVIKTIGAQLQPKEEYSLQKLEMEWKSFRDNELAKVAYQKEDDKIMATLKLSYNNLESPLKHCFAYCSLFPKHHEIDVQKLIKLWIAQGFIKPDRSSEQLEEIAYDYFTILFLGCFFQEAKIDKLLETIKYCKMHDLMHDLATSVAGKSIKILDGNKPENAFEKVRHIYVNSASTSSSQIPILVLEQKKMRTFFSLESESLTSSKDILSKFKLLRALSLKVESKMKTFPNNLGKLKHLRYLDLSGNNSIKELPNSITGLYNLQTLILSNCRSLVSLPADIKCLTKLRHLEIDGCDELTHMPRGIGELTSIQTLDMFVVAANQSSESAGFGELSKLNNLRGGSVIEIKGLGESGAAQCLKNKEHLQSLVLKWDVGKEMMGNAKEAFECLKPHQNIKAIKVNYYPGETFPNWLSSLSNLVRLELENFKECKYLPPLHHLSSLQNLELYYLPALEYVSNWDRKWDKGDHLSTSSRSFFPSLKSLRIRRCEDLKGWWGREIEEFSKVVGPQTEHHQEHPFFPNLTYLEISNCPLLISVPLFPNLEELKIDNTSSKPLEQTIMMKLKSDSVATTSTSLASSSSFSPLSKLKYLTIRNNSDLESLPEAIENLLLLKNLSIVRCNSLTSLPEGIGSLSSLTNLTIEGCSSLTSLPEGIGSLSSLTNLTIEGCSSLTSLPEGIGSLSLLTSLMINECSSLTSLLEGIGSLSSLTSLMINKCSSLTSLLEGIGGLSSLTSLVISECSSLTSLPEEIGSLSSLTHLIIYRCSSLTSLPEGIGSLSSLTHLTIERCSSLTSLPEGIGSLSSLTDLIIDGCSSLTSLPEGIGSLSSLTHLRINIEGIDNLSLPRYHRIDRCSSLTSLPEGIGNLSSLTNLTIEGCSNLTSLPEEIGSLSSLKHLRIDGCSSLTSLPEGISNLSSLTNLTIEGCSNLTSLPEEIGNLSSLTHLRIDGCSSLTSLPEGIGSLSSHTHLIINGCSTSLLEWIGRQKR